jgi:hypothetical protein
MDNSNPMINTEFIPYTCYRTKEKIKIDGQLSEKAWKLAPKSPRFVEVVSGAPAIYDTRSALLWDDDYLYIGFWIEEPFVEAYQTERDSLIFLENDVEVFIDGGDAYYEFEINALNTVYEVFMIWKDAYRRGGEFDVPEFDVLERDAYTFGGNDDRSGEHFWKGTHPRGLRWAFRDWDFPGLKTAVHIEGKLNDKSTIDKGWKVELAFPWQGMKWLANGRSLPPKEGDEWRIQFARYEKLISTGAHVGWTWDKIGWADNHRPEAFTRIIFSNSNVEDV